MLFRFGQTSGWLVYCMIVIKLANKHLIEVMSFMITSSGLRNFSDTIASIIFNKSQIVLLSLFLISSEASIIQSTLTTSLVLPSLLSGLYYLWLLKVLILNLTNFFETSLFIFLEGATSKMVSDVRLEANPKMSLREYLC